MKYCLLFSDPCFFWAGVSTTQDCFPPFEANLSSELPKFLSKMQIMAKVDSEMGKL